MEIIVGNDHWKYSVYGRGPGLLIGFHGYGQDASAFRHLAENLEDYTILAIDLAFHGLNAPIDKGFSFDQKYANDWLNTLLAHLQRDQVGLIGFSIGARVAMFIASIAPDRINELWLLAPDGLPISPIYRFLTATWLGSKIFKNFVKDPNLAIRLIQLGRMTHLLSEKTGNFFLKEIETKAQRLQLFNTWIAYRRALPERKVLQKSNQSGLLPVTCILGKRDAVISFGRTRKQLKRVFPQSAFFEVDIGHNLLSAKAGKLIIDLTGQKKSDYKPLYHSL